MAYWLFKSEPGSWSWDDQVKAGKAGTEWTGVRNFTAQGNMKKMKKGDEGFFYHSGEGKEIVGVVSVIKDAHPEPGNEDWQCVTLAAGKPVPRPVTLATIKADKKFAAMALVKYSRLSVQPVTDAEWKAIGKMAGL